MKNLYFKYTFLLYVSVIQYRTHASVMVMSISMMDVGDELFWRHFEDFDDQFDEIFEISQAVSVILKKS